MLSEECHEGADVQMPYACAKVACHLSEVVVRKKMMIFEAAFLRPTELASFT